MSIIRLLKISLVWTDAFPVNAPTSALRDAADYKTRLDEAKTGGGVWQLPWLTGRGQHFWEHYLEMRHKDTIEFEKAWRHLMPLRPVFPVTIKAGAPEPRIALETFCYPHGAAVRLILTIAGNRSFYEAVDLAIKSLERSYQVTWPDKTTGQIHSLKEVAAQTLERLYEKVLFNQAPPHLEPLRPPASIAGIINAQGFPCDQIISGGELHRALEGLCTLNLSYKINPPQPLDQQDIMLKLQKNTPASHLVYNLDRGAAIWFPSYHEDWCQDYRREDLKISKLGCYQRNLSLLTVQLESLIALMYRLGALIKADKKIPPAYKNIAINAANILGRLFGGRGSYRTWLSRVRIGRHREVVDRVRQHLEIDPLK